MLIIFKQLGSIQHEMVSSVKTTASEDEEDCPTLILYQWIPTFHNHFLFWIRSIKIIVKFVNIHLLVSCHCLSTQQRPRVMFVMSYFSEACYVCSVMLKKGQGEPLMCSEKHSRKIRPIRKDEGNRDFGLPETRVPDPGGATCVFQSSLIWVQ